MTYSNNGIYINPERLDAYGENVARSFAPHGTVTGLKTAAEVYRQLREIREIHDRLQRRVSGDAGMPQAYEWLLDNWYLAQREGLAAAIELKNAGRLQAVEGKAMIYELCSALVHSGQGEITRTRCELFLTGFQRSRVLSRRELSLFVPALRAALISMLHSLCKRLESSASEELAQAMGRVFSSLRLLGNLDLSETLEKVDRTEQILRRDPAGVYSRMDEKTREHYRRQVEKLSKRHRIPEHRVAQRVLKLAENGRGPSRHVGYYLFTEPLGQAPDTRGQGLYIGGIVFITLFFSLLLGFMTGSAAAALLLIIPISELVKNLLDFILLRIIPPRHVPRMELRDGVPLEGRTLCVISALITGPDSGKEFARKLEEYRLANRDAGENLLFGILADLPDTKKAQLPGADEWIKNAAEAIENLNKKYGGGFFFLCRERILCQPDGRYMGWERKRGAIMELARLLMNGESSLQCVAGYRLGLRGVRYIMTLDSDTRLDPGTARELIGAMLHPLNRPVFDEKKRIVTRGYGIIHPRMAVELESAGKSDFSRIFAGQGGTDPYGIACGEIYMDLFDRGGFSGKGIIDAKMLLDCMEGRIPENRVLSHDALEGAYLRGGFMDDVELTDCFPSSVSSYYKRMHRWTRGDWQNIPWLFRRGMELSDVERWKIFDNLRRSLVSPLTFAAIFAGFLMPVEALSWAAAAALLSTASRLLLTMAEDVMRRGEERKVRYHSAVLHGLGGAIVQTAVRLILLPFEAWVCFSAMAVALWRMLVSHKNLLSWQTAAQSEAKKGSGPGYYREMWFSVVAAVISMGFAPSIIGKAAGVIWLLSPLYAALLSRERTRKRQIDSADREYLLQCCREMWRFFETFIGPENHFLPPDNFQEQPPVGLARRTSPTNIGLCLLSALCALDLKITSEYTAMGIIENLLCTMERLPKWKGHLYNWYDTATLKSLEHRYVSTVDSGNLAACLITLREGLLEYGRTDLAAKADALLRPMDFRPLYDEARRLFYIGLNVDQEETSSGWYDLLASEARLSGYVAIAKGDVPRRHWRRLGRSLVQKDGFRGMASWTGTMFEYLMPELMMPCYKDSLLYESAKFCLYVQKRRPPKGIPWGISESAFYALDPSLNYRYKAHGCGALALKRGMDRELVVSPYSTFLALTVDPKAAIRNLKRLDRLGARGRFGFWEAVDFTPSRCRQDKYEIVRCVMAHHIGMSIVAVANYLCDGCCQRRFMADPAMAAHAGLLKEKVPIGGVLLRQTHKDLPEKPPRLTAELWRQSGAGTDYEKPACCLLSNGTFHVMLTESGISSARYGDVLLYKTPRRQLGEDTGLKLHYCTTTSQTSLLPLPDMHQDVEYSWEFSSYSGTISAKCMDFQSRAELSVDPREPGMLWQINMTAGCDVPTTGKLDLSFEPVLYSHIDYVNHPAFISLGMYSYVKDGALMIKRLRRGKRGEFYLCLACDKPIELSGAPGWLSGSVIHAQVQMTLKPGHWTSVRFVMSLAGTEKEAYASAQRILSAPECEKADLPSACAALLRMEISHVDAAMNMIKYLAFPRVFRPHAAEAAGRCREGKEGLWRFGVSGDVPILCTRLNSADELPAAEELVKQHALLSTCGLPFDLVFITDDGGNYRRPLTTAIWDLLRKYGRESFAGIRGGVHIADASSDTSCLLASANMIVWLNSPRLNEGRNTEIRYIMSTNFRRSSVKIPEYRWNDDNSFSFYVNQSLPPRAWGNILTNGVFGFFATDCGTGNMWYKNARECRINRWINDPRASAGTENLELIAGNRRYSLFAGGDGHCIVTYDFGAAVWEKRIGDYLVRTTAFVPADANARVLIIDFEGAPGAHISWCTELLLSGDEADAQQVVTAWHEGVLMARNPRSPFPDRPFVAASSTPPSGFTCDRFSWLRGDLDGRCGAGYDPCFGAIYPIENTLVLVCGCDDISKIRALADPAAAREALEKIKKLWRRAVLRLKVNTPDKELNQMINGWLPYQTLACRMMGRTSIYQSGGAFGFRDQLQDSTSLILVDPGIMRRHILECCSHQFEEGDVQHWWNPGRVSKGVRTRCSDDLVWLPWALCEYVEKTGDTSICHETVHYLRSKPLEEDQHDRYESPDRSPIAESVVDHCRRVLDMVLKRGTGVHGLLLIGSGDWNDGMDRVGAEGRGESVWLTWFFAHTARRFGNLLKSLGGEFERGAEKYLGAAASFGRTANDAWDGQWYLRGYYDDGTPLGSQNSDCCRIDSIAQSFSTYCPESDPKRRAIALNSAVQYLFDRKNKFVKLFDPPFENSKKDPGYIQSYGPGFRENGGQYTHAAVWLVQALLREGRFQDSYEMLKALLPANHDLAVYEAEPYVIAADVYANPDYTGRAGWSWYTGSSGWLYRVCVEDFLGLRPRGGRLYIEPRIPQNWEGYSAVWRSSDGTEHRIDVHRGEIFVDGQDYDGTGIPM